MAQLSVRILARCLNAIERGDATLEECLARHPRHREELMPILEMATMLHDDPTAGPRPTFRHTARQRLLDKLPPRTPPRQDAFRSPSWGTLPRRALAWVAATVTIVVILGSSAIAYAGTRTLPGDALYPVKTTMEEARLWVARGEDDVQLSLRFAEGRIQEIRLLGTIGRFQDVPAAAGRFGAQIQCADQALLKLAENEPELAASLALRAAKARTQYRRELNGLLQSVPDAERPALEGILDGDDSHLHELFEDQEESHTPQRDSTTHRPPEWKEELHPDDDHSPLTVELPQQDDAENPVSEDAPDGPEDADKAPEDPESSEGSTAELDHEDGDGQDAGSEHDREHEAAITEAEPERDDDGSDGTTETNDHREGDGEPDDGEHDESDGADSSDDEDSSDDREGRSDSERDSKDERDD
jgi:hypothetical protein